MAAPANSMRHLLWSSSDIPIPPPRVDSSKGPPRQICIFFAFFAFFRSMKKLPQMAPNGARRIFPTNPDLADILGRTDLNFTNFYFFIFWTPNCWIFRSPDLQISGFPGPQISKFPDFQVHRFPDADTVAAGRILRSQPDPSPNAPMDQIRRKGPCCDVRT